MERHIYVVFIYIVSGILHFDCIGTFCCGGIAFRYYRILCEEKKSYMDFGKRFGFFAHWNCEVFILFPTEFPYVDLWVFGKTKEQIIEVYGEPEYNEYQELAYETKWMFMDMFYYVIEFDENGRTYRMYESPYVGQGG